MKKKGMYLLHKDLVCKYHVSKLYEERLRMIIDKTRATREKKVYVSIQKNYENIHGDAKSVCLL